MIANRILFFVTVTAIASQVSSCSRLAQTQRDIDSLRLLEAQRLAALVDANIEVASRLHADDFELVTPSGDTYSKEQYLGDISSGVLNYVSWEPQEFTVRVYGEVAAIRYEDSDFLVAVDGEPVWAGRLTHTNVYEKRDGDWVIVWSHASGGESPASSE